MKRFYRKALIYLLAVAMVAPAWLANGMFSATKASAAPLEPIMTEVYVSGSNDWIEIFNPNSTTSINVIDYKVRELGPITDQIYSIDEEIIIPQLEAVKIEKASFSPSLNLSSSSDVLWREVSFLSPGGIILQNPAKYGLMTTLKPVSPKSLQFVNSTGTWIVASTTPNAYSETSPLIDFDRSPDTDLFNGDYKVSATFYNSADNKIQIDSEPLTQYDGEVTISTPGSHVITFYAYDGEGNAVSAQTSFTIDKTAPIITPIGDAVVNVEQGTVYTDLGATALDNLDGDITSKISVFSNVNTAIIANGYIVTYDVTDAAGNPAVQITRTVNVVPQTVLGVPNFTVTPVTENGKNYAKVEWDGVGGGVDGYDIYVDGVWNFEGKKSDSDAGTKYSRMIEVSKYGTFNVLVVSKKGALKSTNTTYKTVTFVAPKVVSKVVETPAPVAAPLVTAVQAAPAAEQKVETPSDDKGQIKGEEETTSEEEDINWTPWIVLFVLILLAGAATGGYFYWFAGSEDEENKPVAKEEKKIEKTVVKKNNSKAPNRKSKRW